MKRILLVLAVLILPLILLSQETKYEYTPKVKNKLEVTNLLGKIILKNADGNAIIIESDFNLDKPDRAEGLQLLGASEDNTDLGINISEEDGVVKVFGVTKKVKDYTYTIYVPKGIDVNVDYHSPFAGSDFVLESYQGSVEVKTLAAAVKIVDCTGPFTVSSISGDIEAVFSDFKQEHPSSLASVSGLVDVSLPASAKANIQVSNITGDVYNNLDLKSMSDKDQRADGMEKMKSRNNSEYTLNGGGQKLFLKSVSGNIYLRKK